MRTARRKAEAVLMNHRRLAELMGMPTATVRDWIERRVLPSPHSTVGTLYFYRAEDARHFLETGRWPAAMVRPAG